MANVQLVGILNVTPDSFSDGGNFFKLKDSIEHADKLFEDGASLIDVGAESTRPAATALTGDEEWQRLEEVLKVLLLKYPGRVSLDSYHPETIRRAFNIGPVIINDVTGMNNEEMVKTVIDLNPSKVIISQLPSSSLKDAHSLEPVSTVAEVKESLLSKAKLLVSKGLKKQQIILDPGIGFGKTMALNKKLLNFGEEVPGYEVMIGYSRKRFLGENRMDTEPNISAGKIAIEHGARYLRVHDVAAHYRLLKQFLIS